MYAADSGGAMTGVPTPQTYEEEVEGSIPIPPDKALADFHRVFGHMPASDLSEIMEKFDFTRCVHFPDQPKAAEAVVQPGQWPQTVTLTESFVKSLEGTWFFAKGIENDWVESMASASGDIEVCRPLAWTCIDTKFLTPNTTTHCQCLCNMHYKIYLRPAKWGKSHFAFSAEVTPGQIVARWATHVGEACPGGSAAFANCFDLTTEGTEADRSLVDGAYWWAAEKALTVLEVGLCSHESEHPPNTGGGPRPNGGHGNSQGG